jgi:glycosyltransferase involved in cell wall biosynthesis
MRILHVIAGLEVGGAERMLLTLVEGSRRLGTQVAVAAPPGRFDSELDPSVSRFHYVDHGRAALGTVASSLRIGLAIRRFGPDLVHGHNVRATAMAALGSRAAQPRRPAALIATFHGVAPGEYPAAARWLARAATVVACVSTEVQRALVTAGFPASRTLVVHNGVTPPPELGDEGRRTLDRELGLDGAPVVAIVGRLAPVKAHHRFLQTAALVAREVPAARFLVVGDGPLRGALEEQAQGLGIADRVRFTGNRDDVRQLLSRATVMLMTSDSEGLSIAVIEALAAGVPVVSTPAAGMGELLDGGGGIIVPSADATALAVQVTRLLVSPELRLAMGESGRRLVSERFSAQRMIGDYLELSARVISARRAGGRA